MGQGRSKQGRDGLKRGRKRSLWGREGLSGAGRVYVGQGGMYLSKQSICCISFHTTSKKCFRYIWRAEGRDQCALYDIAMQIYTPLFNQNCPMGLTHIHTFNKNPAKRAETYRSMLAWPVWPPDRRLNSACKLENGSLTSRITL